jgi:hypothetical protein
MKFARQLIEIKSDPMRRARLRGGLDHVRVYGNPPQQREFGWAMA